MVPDDNSDSQQPQRPRIRLRSVEPTPTTPPASEPLPASTPTPTPVPAPADADAPAPATVAASPAPSSGWGDVAPVSLAAGRVIWVAMGVAVALALAVVVSLDTAIAAALLAVAVAASLGRLAGLLRMAQVPKHAAGFAACGVAVVLLGVLLLAGGALWQRQAAQYGARLSAIAQEAGGLAAKHDVTEPVPWLARGAAAAENAINHAANAAVGRRLLLFVQLALLVGALAAMGLLRPAEGAGGTAKAWGIAATLLAKFFSKIGLWMSSRLAKAAALAVLTGVGLQMAGVTAPWFVAGVVLALAIVLRQVPIVVVLAAAPMVPWDASWMKAAGIVLGTGVALFFAEKKLHWYWYLRPALASGLILAEVHGGEEARATRSLFSNAGAILRVATSLLMLALVAGLLWLFVPWYQQQRDRQEALDKAEALLDSHVAQATTNLLELAGRYPNEPKILCDLAQAYALAGDNSNATRYAEAYAAWEPKPTTGGLREKLCQQVLKKFNADKPAFNRAEGYEFILRQDKTDKEASSKARQELAAKIVALNPDSTLGLNTLANECLLSNQPDRAIECARRGQQLNPRDTTWRALLADAYMAKKDYANVVAECDAILASNPDDSRISALRALAARMQEQKSK